MAKERMMSQSRFKELQEELGFLKTTRADEVKKKIEEARRSGDLAENKAYDAAQEERCKLEGRVAEVEEALRQALREELVYLRITRTAEVEKMLDAARCSGDLFENTEYKAAKEEQSRLHARIAEMEKILQGYELTKKFTIYRAALLKYKGSGGNVVIPGNVEKIGYKAFYSCTRLTRITIPESVTHIGDDAFASCTGLTQITIPGSVTHIGNDAFAGCTGLTRITIPESVTHIGDYAFADCTGLTQITIPESVTHIGAGAFAGCTNLAEKACAGNQSYCTMDGLLLGRDGSVLHSCPSGKTGEVAIPESVTEIADGAFENCSGLTGVVIPEGVTRIGANAFFGCSGLASITIPENVKEIGNQAFWGCSSLVSVKIPEGVVRIGYGTFVGCKSLASVAIPESVTRIGNFAFCGCSSLASVIIPESVTEIGDFAFYRCSGLASVTLPESVTQIGNYAFSECSSLAGTLKTK